MALASAAATAVNGFIATIGPCIRGPVHIINHQKVSAGLGNVLQFTIGQSSLCQLRP